MAKLYTAGFDGSAKPNPGEMTIGGWIKDLNGKMIHSFSEEIGYGTNNEAEYLAFIKLLEYIKDFKISHIDIQGDSFLVVNQMNGVWKIKNSRLKELNKKAFSISEGMVYSLKHVLRKYNSEADQLTR